MEAGTSSTNGPKSEASTYGTYASGDAYGAYAPGDAYGAYAPGDAYGAYAPGDAYVTYAPGDQNSNAAASSRRAHNRTAAPGKQPARGGKKHRVKKNMKKTGVKLKLDKDSAISGKVSAI